MEMEEIDLRELILTLWKRVWMIVIVTALSIAISGIVSFFVLVPQYETFTTLMLSKQNQKSTMGQMDIEYNDVLLNQKLVTTYGELAKSRIVANEVIKNLKLDMTPTEFSEKINVSLVKDTEIIKISVLDEDKKLATKIADETAKVFMKNVTNIMKIENVQVIDKAEVPEAPIKPRPLLNIAIAGILGLMISVFIAFILEYLDNTIKTPADIEKHLGLPIMGMIPINEQMK